MLRDDVRSRAAKLHVRQAALPINQPPSGGQQGGVRRFQSRDVPDVCEMFCRTFASGRHADRHEIADAFRQVYLTSPLDQMRSGSLVDVGPAGRIDGFMGMITLSARLDDDRPLRVGVLGNFMATANADRAHVALRLLRATMAHDLDLVVTDTANRTSMSLARSLKFDVLPSHSLEWIKVLRPAGTLRFLLERRLPRLGRTLAPIARLADLGARHLPAAALPEFDVRRYADREIDADAFLKRSSALTRRYRLRPDWDEPEFAWLLDQARRKTRNGPLQLREVVDRGGRTLGLYLLHATSGAAACALQILSRRGQEPIVLAALIRRAAEVGAVAVRGNTDPDILAGLSLHDGVIFRQVAASVAFSRDPEVRAAVRSGNVMVGGLLGESWTRFVAAEFRRKTA